MFDAVRNNPKIVQGFLVVITLPFAFFGVEAYLRNGGPGGNTVAKVGKTEISSFELDQAVREQANALRQQMGGNLDSSLTETPEFKAGVLDRLINEAAVREAISTSKLVVSNESVQNYIKQIPEFQENGHFSFPLYQAYTNNQGLTPQGFEQRIRESLAQQQLMLPVAGSAAVAKQSVERLMSLEAEKRTVSELDFTADAYLSKVALSDAAVRKFYDDNQASFRSPEQVRVEYTTLSLADILQKTNVTEADAHKWFDENGKQFAANEERRASHILIQVPADAKPEVREAAHKKAEDILAKVKADPARFAELAKENSDDTGSAEKGGDLGFFGHGAMVKPFEDAVFALKPKGISDLVQSEFGYHIIMLTDVRGEKGKTFDEVKAEAMEGARNQAANQKFSELSEQFSNMVYEQSDALKPVAEKFGLKLVDTDWTNRDALPAALTNAKVQAALFSNDSLQNRHNSEAIDIGNNTIVSARVVDYKAAAVRPFDEARKDVETAARKAEATRLAIADGEAALKKAQAGEPVSGSWTAEREVMRSSADLSLDSKLAIFSANAEKLPSWVGAKRAGGYAVFKISKVDLMNVGDNAPGLQEATQRQKMISGQEDLRAFIQAIRKREGVQLKKAEADKN